MYAVLVLIVPQRYTVCTCTCMYNFFYCIALITSRLTTDDSSTHSTRRLLDRTNCAAACMQWSRHGEFCAALDIGELADLPGGGQGRVPWLLRQWRRSSSRQRALAAGALLLLLAVLGFSMRGPGGAMRHPGSNTAATDPAAVPSAARASGATTRAPFWYLDKARRHGKVLLGDGGGDDGGMGESGGGVW